MTKRLSAIACCCCVLLTAGCGASTSATTGPEPPMPQPAPTPSPDPAPTPSPDPAPTPTPDESTPPPAPTACVGPAPSAGFVCVQHCGPPVSRQGDPPPGYGWMSPEDARRRQQYGCPRCLPGETRIATPNGERTVSSLRVGDPIWTLDLAGQRVAARVVYAGSTPTSGPHQVVRVTLADGRVVAASAGHPTATGSPLSALRSGDALSGSVVLRTELTPMAGDRTFDVLPSGPTGAYWTDDVVLGSSFTRHVP